MTLVVNPKDHEYLEWLNYKIQGCEYYLQKQNAKIRNMFSDDNNDRYVQQHEDTCRSGPYHDAKQNYEKCSRNLKYYKEERLKTIERINNSLANIWNTSWPTLAEAYAK